MVGPPAPPAEPNVAAGEEEVMPLEEVARHIQTEAWEHQEDAWAGDYDGRQHWSMREVYRLHRDRLQGAMGCFDRVAAMVSMSAIKTSPFCRLDPLLLARIAEFVLSLGPSVVMLLSSQEPPRRVHRSLIFAARKRPLLGFELSAGDWDCVSVDMQLGRVVCHDGRMHRSGRRLEMLQKMYMVDKAFDQTVGDEQFFQEMVNPLLVHAKQGEGASLVCYGQTGTGKTHTLRGSLDRLSRELVGTELSLMFFEVHGKKCYDLLQERKEVALRADSSERVHVRGAVTKTLTPTTAGELMQVLEEALVLRTSEATERNPVSSRSHAICCLELAGGGVLRLVDLAGSERNYETHYMSAQQHRESAEINCSLMALKDCFREHAKLIRKKPGRPPYRASRLTQVLRSCFTDPNHRTVILATLSPTATDLIHSGNSLHHVTQMSVQLSNRRAETVVFLPLAEFQADRPVWEWSTEEVHSWLAVADGGRFASLVLPPHITGASLLRLSSMGLANVFAGDLRRARVEDEGQAWNEAADEEAGARIGRRLFAAIRREAIRWLSDDQQLPGIPWAPWHAAQQNQNQEEEADEEGEEQQEEALGVPMWNPLEAADE
mmetsp:Transcript_39482/g.86073  ORF Transcript_39482/g.86073 Transcript_39482/m.86073 type:complete len:604 (-) Transcript_39482:205-2016(-)|eukprot:CAMPEP_0204391774 /NCGR_PEP_ID=MMETSP0469-20131031/61418_1 /ASSEMBLY_ACC=CAM_ASM_000384 /TAXON_ID=2969 /ORGANISM="Oxyrrhis marina" /LENGTH=603 /DNA_ID=CAMNT_0051385735 /DNA_START=38 /DNA_END=1849 /DNA_ORIENTATION=-